VNVPTPNQNGEGLSPRTFVRLPGEQTHPVLILAAKLKDGLRTVILLGTPAVRPRVSHAGAAIRSTVPRLRIEATRPFPKQNDYGFDIGNRILEEPKVLLQPSSGPPATAPVTAA